MNITPDQVEEVVRWYILAGPVLSMSPERMATMGGGGGGGGGERLGSHTTVGLILCRCPYKVDGVAPIYLAVRAELRYETVSREFMAVAEKEAQGLVSFVKVNSGMITLAEALRQRMEWWDNEGEWLRACPQFDPCIAWLGAEFAIACEQDKSLLPLVMGW